MQPRFLYERLTSNGISQGYYPAHCNFANVYMYGNGANVSWEIESSGRFWKANGLDPCGNPVVSYSIYDGFSSGSNILQNPSISQISGAYKARNISISDLNYHSTFRANCPACPHFWDTKIFEITGLGIPQLQISCTGKMCPPETACQCDCGKEVCCYSAQGAPIYSYLK
jgi:hypothetical protein